MSQKHRKLVILRFVDLDEGERLSEALEQKRRENIALLLKGAQREAYDWDLQKGVEWWNPNPMVQELAMKVKGAETITREQYSIPSLRWHPRAQSEVGTGVDDGKGVEWVNNEFFAWC